MHVFNRQTELPLRVILAFHVFWTLSTSGTIKAAMVLNNFVLPCIVLLVLIADSSCTQLHSCPLGLYCPGGHNCKDASECVDSCYVINATHQGNGTTGRCEDGKLLQAVNYITITMMHALGHKPDTT